MRNGLILVTAILLAATMPANGAIVATAGCVTGSPVSAYVPTTMDTQPGGCDGMTKSVARDCLDDGAVGWYATGEYTGGSGSIKVTASCGGVLIASCTATQVGVPCKSADGDAKAGELDCTLHIMSGSPTGATGQCVDPLRPDRVVPAVVVVVEDLLEG